MPVRVKKLHPALKHAGYSAVGLLPGENKAEFEKLHRDLIAEFAPHGVFEDDIVATMARLLWRKKNLETFRVTALAQGRCHQIRREKIPGHFSLSRLEAFEAVDSAEREAATQAAEDQARRELGETYALAEMGELATVDGLMKDLDIQDRLDAVIERCIKRLLMVRGVKSISSASSSAPQRRLAGPSKAA
jgi:hypothetical protein